MSLKLAVNNRFHRLDALNSSNANFMIKTDFVMAIVNRDSRMAIAFKEVNYEIFFYADM